MKQFLLTISAIFSLILLTVGLCEIKELNFYNRYSIYYGSEGTFKVFQYYAKENELYAAVFWILCLLAILLLFWIFKKRVKSKESNNKSVNYLKELISHAKSIQILLISLLSATLLTVCYIEFQEVIDGSPPVLYNPELATGLTIERYPEFIKSNEVLHIKVKQGFGSGDADYAKKNNEVLLKEYQATARLQSAFVAPGSLQDWQPKKPIKFREAVEWNWILKPDLDRFGQQKILIEGAVYDNNNKMISEAVPILIAIDVKTPLGLPSWMAYLVTFLGGVFSLAFVGWFWMFIYERYIKKESAKETNNQHQEPKNQTNSKVTVRNKNAQRKK